MIKEELQAQINILYLIKNSIGNKDLDSDEFISINDAINQLEQQLQSAKSIDDLILEARNDEYNRIYESLKGIDIEIERKAFEAGRENSHHIIEGFYNWDYDTFEDYLKSKENES